MNWKPSHCSPSGQLALLLLLLSGCTTLMPPHVAPDSALPADYRPGPDRQAARTEPTATAVSAAEIAWQDYFHDPRLQAVIQQALRYNHDLRSAALRVQQAQAAYRIERSAQVPGLSLAAEAKRARTPADRSDSDPAMVANAFQAGVGISRWEIDFWGRIASLNEAALQEFLATRAGHRALTLSLVAQVADAWLTLHELQARLRLAQAAQASQSESLRLFHHRLEVGRATRLEVTQIQTLLTQAEALVLQLQHQRDRQWHALNLLVGRSDPVDFQETAVDAQNLLRPLAPGLPSELLVNRPDIVAAEHRLRAANANIGAARAAFFPRISLTAFGGLASGELSDLFKGDSRAWSVAPSLALPIFDGGLNQAHLDQTQAHQRLAIVEYQHAIQSAFRDVADALSGQHWLQQQWGVQRQAVAIQAERSRLARLGHARGRTGFLEVLDADRNHLEAQQHAVQAQHALLRNQVALYAALGGGSRQLPDAPLRDRFASTPASAPAQE